MKHKAFDGFLLVVVVIGGVLAGQTAWERSRLLRHYARLVQLTSDLPITDASKVHVHALETGEPLHFAWRVYIPANSKQTMATQFAGGRGSSSLNGPSEFIARVRFRPDREGRMEVYEHFGGTSGRMTFGDQALAGLLRDRWDRVRVEQLGAPGLAVIEPDQPAVFLRLSLPDDLLREARKKHSASTQPQLGPVLYELNLNPRASVP
jgi:hypothetical protein